MQRVSLKTLFQKGIVNVILPVNQNVNGYPFVTCLSKDGKSNNVYFGKRSAARVTVGEELSVDTLKKMELIQTVNGAGEVRFKFSTSGPNSGTNLNSIFDEETVEVDLDLFKAEFTAAPVNSTAGM